MFGCGAPPQQQVEEECVETSSAEQEHDLGLVVEQLENKIEALTRRIQLLENAIAKLRGNLKEVQNEVGLMG